MIQIGNTPVMMTDPSGRIDQYIEKHHSLELMRAFAAPASERVPRGSNLLFPNYPSLPAPKLNQLVIPTGATRWGYGLFMVTTDQKNAILTEAATKANKLKLTFGAPNNWQTATTANASKFRPNFTLTMSPLPPRPMTPTDFPQASTDIQGMWILPMVDQRYWWQFLNVDLIESAALGSIQGMVDYLVGKLNDTANLTLTCPNPKHDKIPDIATGNNYENVAVVLESLAWHIGCQLVPELNSKSLRDTDVDTGFSLISVDDSEFIHANNLKGKIGIAPCTRAASGTVTSDQSGWEIVGVPSIEMGGPLQLAQGSAFLPEKVLIPVKGTGATFVSRKATDVGLTDVKTIAGTSAVFRLKWKGVDSPPDSLRDQATKDFYNRFKKVHDYTFAGVQKWQMTAYDDCLVVWQSRFADGVRCQTRVRSWMQNLIPETMVAIGTVATTTIGGGGTAGSCGNCLSCLDGDATNSHTECTNLSGRATNSFFLYKDVSDCCDDIYDNNIELIHVAGGCVWESKEYTCKEKFIEESHLNPANPEIVQNIFFRWILTIGTTWSELEQRFYKKV
jgi:hypothetical protein